MTSDGRRVVVPHYWTPPEAGDASATEFWRTVIDVESGALLATIPEKREHVRTSDTAACLVSQILTATDNQTLYELCYWGGSYPLHPGPMVWVVDLEQAAVLDFMQDAALSGSYFGALAPDGQRLYVLTVSGQVVVVRLPDLTVEQVVALGEHGGPEHIQDYGGRAVFSPDGNLLYLNDRGDPETLYAIELATWQTVAQARLAEGESVYNLALSVDGSRLYVLSTSYPRGMQLSMWDTTTLSRQEVATMPETVYMPARVLAVSLSPAAFTRLFPAAVSPSP